MKTHQFCLFYNRWIIYIFSLYGLFTGSSIAYVIALTVWIWIANFTRVEVKYLEKIQHSQQNIKKVMLTTIIKP